MAEGDREIRWRHVAPQVVQAGDEPDQLQSRRMQPVREFAHARRHVVRRLQGVREPARGVQRELWSANPIELERLVIPVD